MNVRKTILISVIVVSFIAVNLMFFQVDRTEYVVVTQFGKPIRSVLDPGLNWKLPDPIQNIQRFDNRLMVYLSGEAEFLAKDKKNIVVKAYTTWKITDPVGFMKTVKDTNGAEARLTDIVSSELGVAFGQYDLTALITTNTSDMKLIEMMNTVTQNSSKKVSEYGMVIDDVKVKVLSFPEKNKLSVFQRMRAEREMIARKYRSEGTEEASMIRADADKEKKIILSQAYEKEQILKGEGDAQAIRIYADAFQKDPEFYKFLRSLEAYEKFIDNKTTAILSTDTDILEYFENAKK